MGNFYLWDSTHEELRLLVDKLDVTQEGLGNTLFLLALSNPTIVEQASRMVAILEIPGATKFEGRVE